MAILEELRDLIVRTQAVYEQINKSWVEFLLEQEKFDFITPEGKLKVSLKRNCVAKIKENPQLYNLIDLYRNFMVENSYYLTGLQIRSRIKLANSIQSKIETYIRQKDEQGQVPIIKCLNDIGGVRTEIEDDVSFKEIIEYVSNTFPNLIVFDSSKKEYSAVHIYFKNGNYFFPLELQIWFKKDHDRNDKSHYKFKQTYVSWENDAKETKIVKKGGVKNVYTLYYHE